MHTVRKPRMTKLRQSVEVRAHYPIHCKNRVQCAIKKKTGLSAPQKHDCMVLSNYFHSKGKYGTKKNMTVCKKIFRTQY